MNQQIPKQADEETNVEESSYDPNKIPADVEMAKKHYKAKCVGIVKNMKDINAADICPCCGCIIDKEKVSVFARLEDIGFLGSGVSLYFFFIKYCITFLFLIGLVSCIFTMMRNQSGSNCGLITQCNSSFVNNLSIINRNNALDAFTTQAGLNFLATITLIVASIILRKNMKYLNKVIDMDNVTPGDFTVMVTNLRIGTTEKEVVDYIRSWMKRFGEIQILKVVFAYNISEYISTKRLHQEIVLKQIQEKTKVDKSGLSTSPKLTEINEQIKRLEKKVDEIESNLKSGKFITSGTAFVTFGSDNTAEQVVKTFKRGFFGKIWVQLTRIGTLNGQVIKIVRAPEPNDIYWENLCYTFSEKLVSNLITHFFTIVLLVGAFFIIFAISKAQDDKNSKNNNDPVVIFLSFISSLCISIINNGLNIIIKKFALFEKHATLTHYFIGVAQKSGIAQFLNTTIVVYIIKKIKWDNQIFISGGLLSTIHFILLMNAITIFSIFINPFNFLKIWKRKKALSGNASMIGSTPQYKMHEIFEGPKFDFPMNYAKHIKIIMFASFYSYPAPLIVYISLGIIFVCYWLDKYSILRKCQTPDFLSHRLPEAMADFYLELMIVIFCVGNMVFEKLLFDKISGFTTASLVFAVLFWVLDFDAITDCMCPVNKQNIRVRRYDQYAYQFLTDYERANPVTAMKAIEEWTKKLQDNKMQVNTKQTFSVLQNYALNRPGMSTFQPFGHRQHFPRMPGPMNMQFQQQVGGFMQSQFPSQFPQLQGMMGMGGLGQQPFMGGQFRPQFQQQQYGMPQNRMQIMPQGQQQFLNQDPQVLQGEINSLKSFQDQLQAQLATQTNPQASLMIINQLDRNNQRITYLQSLINQQNINSSLIKNPMAPIQGQQAIITNPLQDQEKELLNKPADLNNPLSVNTNTTNQSNQLQSSGMNQAIATQPNQFGTQPPVYPPAPQNFGYQQPQQQQQVFRQPNQMGTMVQQQPLMQQPQMQQQFQYQQQQQPQVGMGMQQQPQQFNQFQQNQQFQTGFNQRPGFIPMMVPQQQQQQQQQQQYQQYQQTNLKY